MANAPRLHALWSRISGHSVLVMARQEWNALSVESGQFVAFDLSLTPLVGVAHEATVIASVAQQVSPALAEVAIFREDLNDRLPVNQDKYWVHLDLASSPDFPVMVTRASTEDNANLRAYLGENVFLVKQQHGADHWLPSLPAVISATIRST